MYDEKQTGEFDRQHLELDTPIILTRPTFVFRSPARRQARQCTCRGP
jgi:hypothetical protein